MRDRNGAWHSPKNGEFAVYGGGVAGDTSDIPAMRKKYDDLGGAQKSLTSGGSSDKLKTLSNVKGNSRYTDKYAKFDSDKYEDNNTYDLETGETVDKTTGYFFTFYQTEKQQGRPVEYTGAEFDRLIEDTQKITGNLYAGKYDGQVEPSFHTEDFATAWGYLLKYRQQSIYNAKTGELKYHPDYDEVKKEWKK
jgi:hypothetical protein